MMIALYRRQLQPWLLIHVRFLQLFSTYFNAFDAASGLTRLILASTPRLNALQRNLQEQPIPGSARTLILKQYQSTHPLSKTQAPCYWLNDVQRHTTPTHAFMFHCNHYQTSHLEIKYSSLVCLIVMWRGVSRERKTANLCNEFIVVELTRRKAQLERTGADRKALVYLTAIANVQKYPLPIICPQQLKHLHGVGEQLATEITSIIRSHYRAFIRVSADGKSLPPNQPQPDELEDGTWPFARSNSVQGDRLADDDDSRSCQSTRSANIDRPYRPRPKTLAANLLIALKKLAQEAFISQDTLKNFLKDDQAQTFSSKPFLLAVTNLAKVGYLQFEEEQRGTSDIRLTTKGLNQADSLEAKTKVKESQLKVKSELSSFMEKQANSMFTSKEIIKEEVHSRQTVPTHSTKQLTLLVDNRQIKDKQEQCFFQSRLWQKYNLKSDRANLPLGDFMWLYDGHVVDCIVERKKADDLASSIYDGRYREQKYRLRKSGFKNIVYLFEGHLTGANNRSEREVESALLNTRVRDGFKVVRVGSITESAKYISYLTDELKKRIEQGAEVETLGLFQDYASTRGKSSQLTIEYIFGMSLKTIPGVGSASVAELLRYFSSWGAMHRQLSGLGSRQERVEFMRGLLKGTGVRGEVPELLVGVLFGEG